MMQRPHRMSSSLCQWVLVVVLLSVLPSVRSQVRNIIQMNGKAYLPYDLNNLEDIYNEPSEKENFTVQFVTKEPTALLWLQRIPGQKMYLALENGYLIFVNKYSGMPANSVIIRRDGSIQFNDSKWHTLVIERVGSKITMTVDDTYNKSLTLTGKVQFLKWSEVSVGGDKNITMATDGRIGSNFVGALGNMLHYAEVRGSKIFPHNYNNILNLIILVEGDSEGIKVFKANITNLDPFIFKTTPPPETKVTEVTFKDNRAYFALPGTFSPSPDDTLAFSFQTTKPSAMIFHCANKPREQSLTMELFDGDLYLVSQYGRLIKRTLLKPNVADGRNHEISLTFRKKSISVMVDGIPERVYLSSTDIFPQELGPMYIGAVPDLLDLPWHTWARQGYQGCVKSIIINGKLLNLRPLIKNQEELGRIVSTCIPMRPQCTRDFCENGGKCVNLYDDRVCDCTHTDYRGTQCREPAPTGLFNGKNKLKLSFRPQQSFHTKKISFRFKALTSNGLLFHTDARNNPEYMRAEIKDGRLLVTTEFAEEKENVYIGEKLNDGRWHTVEINRRADNIRVSIDNKTDTEKDLRGADFYHLIDDIYVGGFDLKTLTGRFGHPKYFIGYIRNFIMGDFDILHELEQPNPYPNPHIHKEPNIPMLIFNDVTFPTYDSHVGLDDPLGSLSNGVLSLVFKTFDETGVMVFSTGRAISRRGKRQIDSKENLFVVELFSGRLSVKLSGPSGVPLDMRTTKRYNDGQWHNLTIVFGQDQLVVSVDRTHSLHGYQGLSNMRLDGLIYLGGLPSSFLQSQAVQRLAAARHGFRGCMASVLHKGDAQALYQMRIQNGILDGCQDIKSKCTKDMCRNQGVCHDHLNNGTTWCDCSKTAFAGPLCADEPLGYYIRSEGEPAKYGMLQYLYPPAQQHSRSENEIVLGVMTDEKDRLLVRLDSILGDFIELRLVQGYVMAYYNTNNQGSTTSITNTDVMLADEKYHIVHFLRKANMGKLTVDGKSALISHLNSHDSFNKLSTVSVGGVLKDGRIDNSTGFRGIIGGLYIDGDLIFHLVSRGNNAKVVKDAVIAPHPFRLGKMKVPDETVWVTDKPIVKPETQGPPSDIPPAIPKGVGGAGIAILVSDGGVGVVLYPDGSGTSATDVKKGPAVSAVATAGMVPVPPMAGPRAGALMGIILGTMIFLSSLMWAFYLCKPGCCGETEAPLVISAPEDTSSPVLASPGILDVPDNSFPFGQKEEEKTKLIGHGGVEAIDMVDFGDHTSINNIHNINHTSTHNINVTKNQNVHNMSTHNVNNTLNVNRSQYGGSRQHISRLGSTASQQSGYGNQLGYRDNSATLGYQPGPGYNSGYHTGTRGHLLSTQSYQPDGTSRTADYDIAVGVHQPQPYKSSTLPTGRIGMTSGHSTSTLASNYNYTMKSSRSIGANSVFGPSVPNVIITPGPMGEEVRVDCCLMTSDGKSVVTGSSLGPPQVWNMADGELLRIMAGDTVGSTFLHLVCNERLLIGAIDADLEVNQYSTPKGVHNYIFQIWDFVTGQPLHQTEPEVCSALCLMSDSDKVVLGRTDNFGSGTNIIVWDLMANQAIKEMRYDAPVGNNDYLSYINLSQNDRFVIAGYTNSFDNQAEFVVFDMTLTSYNVIDPYIMRLDTTPECLAVLPNDEVVSGLRNGDLVIWSLRGSPTVRQLQSYNSGVAHAGEVKAVTTAKNSHYLVSASVDNTLKLWDLHTERLLATLSGHKDEVWCAAISPDNEIIVSGSRDGNIRLWKLRTAREICAFNAGVDVFHICVSDDKCTIVALGDKYGARKLIMLQVVRSKIKKHVLA